MNEFDAQMAQLRAEYRSVVAADLLSLQQQAATLCGDESDRTTLGAMVETLHRIAGGAGVFGLNRLSEQARGLELDLNDWLSALLTHTYRAALPELRAALARLEVKAS